MTVASRRASRGSPGLGVSAARRARRVAGARRPPADTPSSPPKRRRRRARRRSVLASGTVGPGRDHAQIVADDVGDRERVHGPAARAASQPPLIADRCLRTVLSAWMSAPARSSCAVVAACRRASAVGRHRHQRRGAAREQNEQVSSAATARAIASARRPARSLPASASDGRRRCDSKRRRAPARQSARSTRRLREYAGRAPARAPRGHRARRLAGGDDRSTAVRGPTPWRSRPRRGALDEPAASTAANAGPDDRQEIVSKLVSERVSVSAWDPTRPRARSRRRIS